MDSGEGETLVWRATVTAKMNEMQQMHDRVQLNVAALGNFNEELSEFNDLCKQVRQLLGTEASAKHGHRVANRYPGTRVPGYPKIIATRVPERVPGYPGNGYPNVKFWG